MLWMMRADGDVWSEPPSDEVEGLAELVRANVTLEADDLGERVWKVYASYRLPPWMVEWARPAGYDTSTYQRKYGASVLPCGRVFAKAGYGTGFRPLEVAEAELEPGRT